jgi:hypothetical protein
LGVNAIPVWTEETISTSFLLDKYRLDDEERLYGM